MEGRKQSLTASYFAQAEWAADHPLPAVDAEAIMKETGARVIEDDDVTIIELPAVDDED